MRYLFTISLVAGCLAVTYGQITLKKYTDPHKSGYESIVFKRVVGKNVEETVEYDIEAHNPYLTNTSISSTKAGNFNQLSVKYASTLFGVSSEKSHLDKIHISTHTWVKTSENYVAVSYNLWGYHENGEDTENMRKSTLKVIDSRGKEVYSEEINTDSYGVQVSPNGKLLGYGYGEHTHDSSPEIFGYDIINLETKNKLISLPILQLDVAYTKNDYLILRGINAKYSDERSFCTWVIDTQTNNAYELHGKFYVLEDRTLKKSGGLIISNLEPHKIK